MTTYFQRRQEIVKRYTDHLNSLIMSGMDFDESEIRKAWQAEIDELENEND